MRHYTGYDHNRQDAESDISPGSLMWRAAIIAAGRDVAI